MDKERLITIALGLFVGILLAGLYFAAVKYLPQFTANSPRVTFNPPTNNPPPTAIQNLTVTDPADESTIKDSPLTFTGQANPGDKILIFAPAEDKIASADASGKFSGTIKLEEGENEISFSRLANNGAADTTIRNVILEVSP